jgi:hypothetical protein
MGWVVMGLTGARYDQWEQVTLARSSLIDESCLPLHVALICENLAVAEQ